MDLVPEALDACDLCGGSDVTQITEGRRFGRVAPIVQCTGCGLTFLSPRPTHAELDGFYRDEYRTLYSGSTEPTSWFVDDQRRRGERIIERVPGLPARVLDIGCGAGASLLPFRDAGCEVVGIEPGPFGTWGAEHLGIDIYSTANVGDVAGPFDLVLLSFVLEHVASPFDTMASLRQIIDPGARVYLEVPNLLCARGAVEDYFHLAHLTYFTPATLAATLEAAGFDVEDREQRDDYSVWQVATYTGRPHARRKPSAALDNPAATTARLARQQRIERVERVVRGVLKPPERVAMAVARGVAGDDAAQRLRMSASKAWVSTRTRI